MACSTTTRCSGPREHYTDTHGFTHRMIEEARRLGLPVTLYAPGLITGHSQTGIDSLSQSQFVHALIKGSVQLGCFPDGLGWRFIPVDVVARNVVSCLLHPASINHDIYLDSTSLLSPELMVETLRGFGFDVRVRTRSGPCSNRGSTSSLRS